MISSTYCFKIEPLFLHIDGHSKEQLFLNWVPPKKPMAVLQSVLDICDSTPPPAPFCVSYAFVQATVGVGTVIIVYVILLAYEM